MILAEIAFYVFASLLVISALGVVVSRNPIYAVLCLIFAFFNSAGLFIILGAEFVAMLMVIVYVGAVAVLFLFVIMMLNINFAEIKGRIMKNLPLGLSIAVLFLIEMVLMVQVSYYSLATPNVDAANVINKSVSNTEMIASVLYTNYVFVFEVAGLILLVAMVGAMVLTHRKRVGVKKQNITAQVWREKSKSIRVVKVKVGKGI